MFWIWKVLYAQIKDGSIHQKHHLHKGHAFANDTDVYIKHCWNMKCVFALQLNSFSYIATYSKKKNDVAWMSCIYHLARPSKDEWCKLSVKSFPAAITSSVKQTPCQTSSIKVTYNTFKVSVWLVKPVTWLALRTHQVS